MQAIRSLRQIPTQYLDYGPPLCPQHKTAMDEVGDWEID